MIQTITELDGIILRGALDSLGVALSTHEHEWSTGERAVYEEAIKILDPSGTEEDLEEEKYA